jgi:hypothetical protein
VSKTPTQGPVAADVSQLEHCEELDEAQGPPSVLGQLLSMQAVSASKTPWA